jgi:hypothetical protein
MYLDGGLIFLIMFSKCSLRQIPLGFKIPRLEDVTQSKF